MQILLANPRGFCAGVDRAISIVENALAIYGAPIYVRHEVVHNRYVVDSLRERGAIFIEQISEVPDGAILIFSAHGVSQAVRNEAKSRDLTVFDATCPLVTKVHMEVARASRRGEESILIGHAGHPEVEGTMGQYSNPEGLICYPSGKTDKEYIAPDKLELIGGYDISNQYLEKIVLNEGLRIMSSAQLRETPNITSGFLDEATYTFNNL